MSPATYTCQCGATLRYRQDMQREPGGLHATWKCADCLTPIPGHAAERLKHRHPS